MNPLLSELNRLYFVHQPSSHGGAAPAASLVDAQGRVRAMVLELARPTDWSALATVWRGVQTDWDLPAPAIAVSGIDGHQLWFSLSEPVSAADARAFLDALCVRYLPTVDPWRIGAMPGFDPQAPQQTRHARLVPALQAETGCWSAFVSSDLAAIFTDEPWLDLEPNPDAQARLLTPLSSIPPGAFQAILAQARVASTAGSAHPPATAEARLRHAADPAATASAGPALPAAGAHALTARRFLHDVMNDSTVPLPLRIEAAKALLPYGEAEPGHR